MFPSLQKPENSVPALLTWSTRLYSRSITDSSPQLDILREWAGSEDGRKLCEQLAKDIQDSQSMEQLALTLAALMNYRRLFPDVLDHCDQPISGSYLADLDAHLRGCLLGNSGRVAEQMIFALLRVLYASESQHENLITFLEITLDRERPHLHLFDGFTDHYLRLRIKYQCHKTAKEELSGVKMPELGGDDDPDWVNIILPEELPYQKLHIHDNVSRLPSCEPPALKKK